MNAFAWLFAGLVGGLANALYLHVRLQSAIAARTVIRADATRFVRGLALWIMVPCAALWLLQMTVAGAADPNPLTWPQPQKALALAIQCFVLAALVRWTFFRDGADTVLRMLMGAGQPVMYYSPRAIKLLVVLVVLVNMASCVAFELQDA